MKIEAINVRQFRAKMKEYLDLADTGVQIELIRGQNVYTISTKNHKSGDVVYTNTVKDVVNRLNLSPKYGEHGCGCVKSGSYLCKKHDRV